MLQYLSIGTEWRVSSFKFLGTYISEDITDEKKSLQKVVLQAQKIIGVN